MGGIGSPTLFGVRGGVQKKPEILRDLTCDCGGGIWSVAARLLGVPVGVGSCGIGRRAACMLRQETGHTDRGCAVTLWQ